MRKECIRIKAEGARLYTEYGGICTLQGDLAEADKFAAEGERLYAEGSRLCAEANLVFINAVIEAYGKKVKLEWLVDGSCRINDDIYKEKSS